MSKFTEEEVILMEELCRNLLEANEELNAKIIAIDAMLKNEMRKTKHLQNIVREYETRINNRSAN